jgi:hypothetical protein
MNQRYTSLPNVFWINNPIAKVNTASPKLKISHFQKAAFKGLVLGDRDIEIEEKDDLQGGAKSKPQTEEVVDGQHIWKDEKDHSHDVGYSCINRQVRVCEFCVHTSPLYSLDHANLVLVASLESIS